MSDPWLVYEVFNRVEGILWFLVAVAIHFAFKANSASQKWSLIAASLGFVLFGVSDFLEAPLHGQLPAWLWAWKILCATFILSCRYQFIGWRKFRLKDPYLLFGFFCLTASMGAIFLQTYLYGAE